MMQHVLFLKICQILSLILVDTILCMHSFMTLTFYSVEEPKQLSNQLYPAQFFGNTSNIKKNSQANGQWHLLKRKKMYIFLA